MKHFYFFAFLLSGFLGAAQQQVLLETQWQLIDITIGNTQYTVPNNQEANPSTLSFIADQGAYTLHTDVCNLLFGTCAAVDDSSFTLAPPVDATLSICNYSENNLFEGLYFSLFFQASNASASFTYSIVYLDDYPTLFITAPNGDHATYGAYLAGTDSFVKQGFTATPNPASSYVDITLNGSGSGELKIYDVEGRVCRSQPVNGQNRIDVSGLSAGLYLFTVTTPTGSATQKVVIRP